MKLQYLLIVCFLVPTLCTHCKHDLFSSNLTKQFYEDIDGQRLLQQDNSHQSGKIRIFADYTQVTVGGVLEISTITRLINITATYFYGVLKVNRLERLYFPESSRLQCKSHQVPLQYQQEGAIGDLGLLVSNMIENQNTVLAYSSACVFLRSNNRPIWGMMRFNNFHLKYDQEGFQQVLFISLHQMTHILGFSSALYDLYPNGSPLRKSPTGQYYLASQKLAAEVKRHFNCSAGIQGMFLQDQDGTWISSHWEKKMAGNEYMTSSSSKKSSFISNFTLLLLEATGWYTEVNFEYAEPTQWGKNKQCPFLQLDNCHFDQFCSGQQFSCDWDGTAIGRCNNDPFTGSCRIVKHYSNTMCIDQNFQLKNLNQAMRAGEKGGSGSKCFASNFRSLNIPSSSLHNRCYVAVCSSESNYLFIFVNKVILICRYPGQILYAPNGMEGVLICPHNQENYCGNKKSCAYHCNKNGVCINGKCLCTGSTWLTPNCIDISVYQSSPTETTGGFTMSQHQSLVSLKSTQEGLYQTQENNPRTMNSAVKYSINKKCFTGSVLDTIFGECLMCKDVFNCEKCDQNGCISCDDGSIPINNRCIPFI